MVAQGFKPTIDDSMKPRSWERKPYVSYGVLQQQGGALSKLATDVGRTAEGLVVLREKMEQDLWKTVLKGEAAMLEKEGALNEVQAQREKRGNEAAAATDEAVYRAMKQARKPHEAEFSPEPDRLGERHLVWPGGMR